MDKISINIPEDFEGRKKELIKLILDATDFSIVDDKGHPHAIYDFWRNPSGVLFLKYKKEDIEQYGNS